MFAIASQGLRKSYGDREVLHGIDLQVPEGSLYGFLGPNGAGKSTTIRVLLGLLQRSNGDARVFNMDPWREGASLRRRIGYLPGDIALYRNLTGRSTLAFLDDARGLNSKDEILRLAEVFNLELDKRVRDYSRGMKQKLGLIQALMHEPQLLILDEPTMSLDPLVRETLMTELREAAAAGRTVLFSSHTLSEVEQLCDWVGILRDGRLIEQQKIETLSRRAVRRVEIRFADEMAREPKPPTGLKVATITDNRMRASWTGEVQELLHWLAGQRISDVIISPPDLEDLFLAYYSDNQNRTAE